MTLFLCWNQKCLFVCICKRCIMCSINALIFSNRLLAFKIVRFKVTIDNFPEHVCPGFNQRFSQGRLLLFVGISITIGS